MSAFLKKILDVLAPTNEGERSKDAGSGSSSVTRQAVLDALMQQFNHEMEFESTSVSMLFHTEFVVYLREKDYERISPGFQLTAMDAVKLFMIRIRENMKKYPDYVAHSRYWVFQLVNIPADALIDGIPTEEMEDKMILIKSSIFPTDDYESNSGGGRVVTTMHTKSSMMAMPRAVNMQDLLGLDQLAKDKYRIRFELTGTPIQSSGNSASIPSIPQQRPVARLTADDGRFVDRGRVFSTYQMHGDTLRICGRNGVVSGDGSTLLCDSDDVMNPQCIIRRDNASGMFYISALGPVVLNERRLPQGVSQWVVLPDNSAIMINDDIQIGFKVVK
ncbi:MAG: hypothetical protein NC230_06250 [Bacteroides sp.]|nr:hypothetical protein [Bacteroides sp.]